MSLLPGIEHDVYCFINGCIRCFSRLFKKLHFTRIHRTDRPYLALHPRVEREFTGSYLHPHLNGIVSPDHNLWTKYKTCRLVFEYCFKHW